jgi:4-phosphopantoate--beta-alanine ligase
MEIPKSHPRYGSLRLRELIADGYEQGLVDRTGLIAHGRGEAFDYLLGEQTHPEAALAARVAAAHILRASNPVLSVNGNTAVLVPEEVVELSAVSGAAVEVNIFHRTEERLNNLISYLEKFGAKDVLGANPDAEIPGLAQPRAHCTNTGIFKADCVFVPLEDGDRAEALVNMGKSIIVVDLNPLSRSAGCATVTIVDSLNRSIKNVISEVKALKAESDVQELEKIIAEFDNKENLKRMKLHLRIDNDNKS